jgi:hypothetical protein
VGARQPHGKKRMASVENRVGPRFPMSRLEYHGISIDLEILPPRRGETIAISDTPKASALFFDRIWDDRSADEIPREVRCFAGTKWEWEFAKCRRIGFPALMFMDQLVKDGEKQQAFRMLEVLVRDLPVFGAWMRGQFLFSEKRHHDFDFLRRHLDAFVDVGTACLYRTFAEFLRKEKVMRIVPVFPHRNIRNLQYQEGQRWAVQAILCNIGIVDEGASSWAQVIEFRKDVDACRKYRRFLHWLDRDMVGKSLGYVQDEIADRLEDYRWALKKHGLKVITGTIEETLDGRYLVGASGAAASLSLAGYPTLGILAGAGLMLGKVVVKLAENRINYTDLKRGAESAICWVHEVERLQHSRRKTRSGS